MILPDQPLVFDANDVLRFRENRIVVLLLEKASERGIDLNTLAIADANFGGGPGEAPDEDWAQFAQLIGYSVDGWSDLSYVSDEAYARVSAKVEQIGKQESVGGVTP